jgi:hypothetical protein
VFLSDKQGMLVILYRRNEAGQAYYYTLDDRQQNLFKPFNLTVSWGKHPEGGCAKSYVFESLDDKNRMIRSLLNKKLRTYKVLYSYFKEMGERAKAGADFPPENDILGGYRDWAAR